MRRLLKFFTLQHQRIKPSENKKSREKTFSGFSAAIAPTVIAGSIFILFDFFLVDSIVTSLIKLTNDTNLKENDKQKK